VVTCVAGWLNRQQQVVIEYLQEEVRVLQEQLGRRSRFNDDQRRRLALKAKTVGRKGLRRFARTVTPDTLLAWHRRLMAQKYDSSRVRKPGRPRTASELQDLILRMARDITVFPHDGEVVCRKRLGGLLRYYHREAA